MDKKRLINHAFFRGLVISIVSIIALNFVLSNGRLSRDDLAAYFLLIPYQCLFVLTHAFYFTFHTKENILKNGRIFILLIPLFIPLIVLFLLASSEYVLNSPGTSIIMNATYIYLITVILNCWYTESQIKQYVAAKDDQQDTNV
jgi:hypothetical protein